ncbi:MAG: hypothetical protein COA43_00070 [Robiginitomaculum sp.]|nr:MAG: hypothetical protein COA43_00070 [Robiginitomaculum sp.]
MSIVIEPIKAEFGLSDGQIGVLTGLAYALLYAAAGIPIGYLIDRTNRRNLLAGLVTIWSACTAMCGLTQNYWQLLFARLAVGATEAGGAPTALSMIGDLFPERLRATAVSIFWTSTAIGTAVSFGIGGYVAVNYGWRATFFIAGLPGLFLAGLLMFTMREPDRGTMDMNKTTADTFKFSADNLTTESSKPEPAPSLRSTLGFIIVTPALRNIFIAASFKSCVLSGVLVWSVSYFIRVHGLPIERAGVLVGLSIAIFGGIGSLLGGVAGDRAYKTGGVAAQPLVPFVTSLLTAGMVVLLALASNFYVAIAAFAGFEIFSRMYSAPTYAFLISSIPSNMRGVSISALQVGSNLIGYGLGPFIVGGISDQIDSPDSIRFGILALSIISVWVSFHFLLAARRAKEQTLSDNLVNSAPLI